MKGKEVLFVFSAGNEHRDTCLATPASLSNVFPNNVITVAAVDKNEDLAGFSNYGSCVNVAAPGVDIYSTIPNNDYGNKSGTSMAAPFVTGLAALLWSHDDTLTATQVKNLIVQGAKVGGKQLWGPEGYIFYIINAYQSLKLLEEPAETGIEGTVYYSTTPLSNVKVSLWTDTNEIPGTEVYTDENGEYKILYDIPGEYHILAFLPNSVYWSSCYQIVINEGEIILLDFYLIKPLKLLSPPNGAIISDTTPTFVWEANPEVVNYLLSIFDGIPPAGNLVVNQAGITNTSYTLPDLLSPGFYIWSIIGFDLGGNSVTGSYYFEFNIE